MKFKIPGSDRDIWVNIDKYKVNWQKKTKSKPQTLVKQFLYQYLKNHIVCEELRVPRTRLTVDLIDFTSKVVYEIQGAQHLKFIPFFHGNPTGLFRQWGRDAKKQDFFEYNGYNFVQIMPEDISKLSKSFFKDKFGVILQSR